MKSLIFIPNCLIDIFMLADTVEGCGWHWENDGCSEGIISNQTGSIYVSLYENFEAEYDEDDLDNISQELGFKPIRGICIHIGHRDAAQNLANEFIEALKDKYGGVIDAT